MKLPRQLPGYDALREQERSSIIERGLNTMEQRLRQSVLYGGWRDELGQIVVPVTGTGKPVWTQLGSSVWYGWKFAVNDSVQILYHLQHDYLPDSGVYLHTHFTTNGTNTQPVKWQFQYTYAKGYVGDVFDIAGGGSIATAELSTQGAAWEHSICEVVDPITNADFEVDGLIICNVKRITNGGTENTDDVYLTTADMHYQTWMLSTPNKNGPDFYRRNIGGT